MPGIKIVTHCYAAKSRQYATMLRAQISSVIVNPVSVPVTIAVYCTADDANVRAVLADFDGHPAVASVNMEKGWLWRRSIGRDWATRHDVDSDLFWFADCDYLFGPECLSHVHLSWRAMGRPEFLWPKMYLACADKAVCDEFLKLSADVRGLLYPVRVLEQCQERACPRAIGGVQIVDGAYARRAGYLRHVKKWQTPVVSPFPDFRDDVQFRRQAEADGKSVALAIPNLYRIRHTEVGYGKQSKSPV